MNEKIICDLCPHFCNLKEGQVGFCNGRKNIDGEIKSITYGKALSLSLDPIEKKPLYYFKRGSNILSFGTFGCNMACIFCQNYQLARGKEGQFRHYYLEPERLIDIAEYEKRNNNIGIAFTYNEPLINYEYILDVGKLAKEKNLDIVLVSNGQINDKYLDELLPLVSAWNIDLKSFSKESYKKLKGSLDTTLNTIKRVYESGAHLEITTLVVPNISDDLEEFKEEVEFISSLDENIPLHLTRYFPSYKYNEKATDINLMYEMKGIGNEKLNNVMLGNV